MPWKTMTPLQFGCNKAFRVGAVSVSLVQDICRVIDCAEVERIHVVRDGIAMI